VFYIAIVVSLRNDNKKCMLFKAFLIMHFKILIEFKDMMGRLGNENTTYCGTTCVFFTKKRRSWLSVSRFNKKQVSLADWRSLCHDVITITSGVEGMALLKVFYFIYAMNWGGCEWQNSWASLTYPGVLLEVLMKITRNQNSQSLGRDLNARLTEYVT
jgi:hypothetical protein